MTTPLFEMYRGDDYAFRVIIKDETGTPVDITGWEFMATLKIDFTKGDDAAPVKVNIGPMAGPNAEQGVCLLVLPHEQTKDLVAPAMYFFDLQRVFNGIVTTVIKGRVRIHEDITRRTSA